MEIAKRTAKAALSNFQSHRGREVDGQHGGGGIYLTFHSSSLSLHCHFIVTTQTAILAIRCADLPGVLIPESLGNVFFTYSAIVATGE